jgi:nucleotide-binding universal stress UspA family protein
MFPVEGIPATAYGQERKRIAEEILQKAEKTSKGHGIEGKTRLAFGPIEERIVRIAEEGEFDIIFIGRRGLGRLSRMLLGSVAESVLRYAHCSVMLVR